MARDKFSEIACISECVCVFTVIMIKKRLEHFFLFRIENVGMYLRKKLLEKEAELDMK